MQAFVFFGILTLLNVSVLVLTTDKEPQESDIPHVITVTPVNTK